jgi:hypothetical protein
LGHTGRRPCKPHSTHADVYLQIEFNQDVKQAAAKALATTNPGVGLNPLDQLIRGLASTTTSTG